VLGASVLGIDMVRLVGVWSSSGIGVSGRSLNGGAVDGQLPNVMMDCEESDSIDLPALLRFGLLGPGLARHHLQLRVSNASEVLRDHYTGPLRDATAKLVAVDRALTETDFESRARRERGRA
jgi:hypothetical protein